MERIVEGLASWRLCEEGCERYSWKEEEERAEVQSGVGVGGLPKKKTERRRKKASESNPTLRKGRYP